MVPRTDYLAVSRLARALHERGAADREILRECYGVDFPDEFLLLARHHHEELELSATLPWRLAIPALLPAQARTDPEWLAEVEAQGIDPGLVPLEFLRWGNRWLICYHLDELAAGRSTVLGLRQLRHRPAFFDPGAAPVVKAPSLLAALHAAETGRLDTREALYNDPANFGFGSVDDESVEEQRQAVARIEKIRESLTTWQP